MARPLLTNNPYRNTSNTPKQRGRADEAIVKGLKWSGEKAKNNKILLGLCAVVALTVYNCVPWDKFSCESSSAPPSDEAEEREKEKPKDKLSLDVIVKINGLGDIEAQLQEANIKIDDCGDTHPFSISIFTTWEESAPDMARDTDAGTSEWTRKRKLSPMIIFQGHDSEIQYDSDEITATEDELKVGKLVKSVSFVRGTILYQNGRLR